MRIDLEGKVALVTGAGRGIGREIAATLAREGVTTLTLDIDSELVAETTREFAANGWQGAAHLCDVRDGEAVRAVVRQIEADYGQLDVLVNNAGVFAGGSVETLSEAAWDANLDANLKGVFLTCQAVAPIMKRQRAGRIINAASFAAITPSLGSAGYAASKAGVVALTRVLAGELGPWNVTVNCYAPGMIPTQMNHFADAPRARQQQLLDTLTLRRWGQPVEVANLVCFLASDLASYITGALIDVSGGKLTTQIPRQAYTDAAAQGEYDFDDETN